MFERNPFSERYRDNDEDIMYSILAGKYSRREEDETKNGYEIDEEEEELEDSDKRNFDEDNEGGINNIRW